MAKAKKEASSDIFAEIAKETGAELVSNLDQARYFIDTGNFAINYCCSGKFFGGVFPVVDLLKFMVLLLLAKV